VDTLNPGRAWKTRENQTVARKTYSEEFRRDAVKLYRLAPGATVVGIAADLRVMDSPLSAWLKAADVPVHGRPPGPDDRSARPGETAAQGAPACGDSAAILAR
jgi:transposase